MTSLRGTALALSSVLLLALVACGPSGPQGVSPRDKTLLRARSADGVAWEPLPGPLAAGGSSPGLADLRGGLEVLFVQDGETLSTVPFTGGALRSLDLDDAGVDPHAVALPEGGFRLYYVARGEGGDPGTAGRVNEVRSARSGDGVAWRREPGVRWRGVGVDPDVVALPGGGWRMYLTSGAREVRSARSRDGLAFADEPGVRLEGGGVTSTVGHGGGWRMYFHKPTDMPPRVYLAESPDGLAFRARPEALLEGESPAVVAGPDGWRMVYARVSGPSPPGSGPRR